MQGPKKAVSIVFTLLIFFAVLAVNSRADGNDKGIGVALQKIPPHMIGLKNPYAGGSEEEGKAGLKLFKRHCASCHEKNASAINRAPSLNTPSVRTMPPGNLFWYLKNGNLRRGMPAWSSLPEERLWQLVTYLQEAESNQGMASGGTR
jgi:cytochrome c oxidase cbb3-type subunit 2